MAIKYETSLDEPQISIEENDEEIKPEVEEHTHDYEREEISTHSHCEKLLEKGHRCQKIIGVGAVYCEECFLKIRKYQESLIHGETLIYENIRSDIIKNILEIEKFIGARNLADIASDIIKILIGKNLKFSTRRY